MSKPSCLGASVLKNNTQPDATTVTHEHLEERNASARQNLKEHKDRYGMDIPERILPAFMSTLPKMLMRDIGNFRKAIERARDEQDLSFAHFYSYALTDIDNLLRDFRQGVPHCVCRMCRGRGCGSCSELGFQTKLQYDRNPPEFKYDSERRLYTPATPVAPEAPVATPVAPATPVVPKEEDVPDAEVQFDTIEDVSDLRSTDNQFFN